MLLKEAINVTRKYFLCVRNLMQYLHSVTVVLLIENFHTQISNLPILLYSLRYFKALFVWILPFKEQESFRHRRNSILNKIGFSGILFELDKDNWTWQAWPSIMLVKLRVSYIPEFKQKKKYLNLHMRVCFVSNINHFSWRIISWNAFKIANI